MRRSKYPNIGIMDAIEKWVYGGVPEDAFEYKVQKSGIVSSKTDLSKKLYALKRRGFVKYSGKHRLKSKPVITEKGYQYINFARLEELKIENKKRDGLWRVVIFDIPEEKRAAREMLRNKLREFGCYQLQKSVYATRYICDRELNDLAKLLGISEHFCVILAKSLGNLERAVSRHFD